MLLQDSTTRLHVVHVVLSLNVGGLERNVINQVREGSRLGQRVSVLCLEGPGELGPRVAEAGGALRSLRKPPGLRPGFILRTAGALRQLRADVVHTHQLATLLYGGAAARLIGVPAVVHTEHGRERYATRLRTRLLGRTAGKLCDQFYCLTRDMANEIADHRIVIPSKIRVIENGIDVGSFAGCPPEQRSNVRQSLGIPPECPVIGTVGRLTEIKRQDVLIRAFAAVRQRVPAYLLIVGDGPLRNELNQLAGSLGVGNYVRFAGYQPHAGPYLQAMDVFALTSRSEGMPQAVLEASVSQLPVVASNVGGLPEVIEDGVSGILFEPANHTLLATILYELIADPPRRRELGRAARARVEARFSVARMAAEYHRDFATLLGRRGRLRADGINRQSAVSPVLPEAT